MNPSRFRNRLEVWGDVEYENIAGETDTRFELLKKVWGEATPQTGKLQNQQAETILTNVTHKFVIRQNGNQDITKEMEIRYRGHRFKISYILNPYFRNDTLEIFAEEVLE